VSEPDSRRFSHLSRSVQPVQGQVLRVNAPEIKQYYGFGETTYVIPNTDTVVLGGSTDRCDPDTTTATVDEEVRRVKTLTLTETDAVFTGPVSEDHVCRPRHR
jgi:glycine/D-amino acid oxidase-like deaminating enzyme